MKCTEKYKKFVKICVFYWLWGGGGGRGYIFICFFIYILMCFWYSFHVLIRFWCIFEWFLIYDHVCVCEWVCVSVSVIVCVKVCLKRAWYFLIYVGCYGNRAYPLRVELSWIQASNYFERKFTKKWSSLTNWLENGSILAPKELFRLDWDFWTLITGFSMLEL